MTTDVIEANAANAPAETKDKKPAPGAGSASLAGSIWFVGWLFTIGFAELVWWKAILGIVAWPYFLGVAIR